MGFDALAGWLQQASSRLNAPQRGVCIANGAECNTAAMSLGKELDRQLRERIVGLFEAQGWKGKRKPRRWLRERQGCTQAIELKVDGRQAPEGLLIVETQLYLQYAFDAEGLFEIAGQRLTWAASPRGWAPGGPPEFAVRWETAVWVAESLAEYLRVSLLPAADRFADPEQFLLNQLLAGDVWHAVSLCEKLGDHELLPWLIRALGQFAALNSRDPIGQAGWALSSSERSGVPLLPDDREAIMSKLRHELERAGDQAAPYLRDLRRYLK